MNINPISYTSRTFLTVLNDINSDPELSDKPEWFKRIIAGSHDVLSMYQNAIANQSFLRTAFTRQATADLLALIDYYMTEKVTSSGSLIFYLNPATTIFPKTIAVENLTARSQGTTSASSRKFESRTSVTVVETYEGFTTDHVVDNNLDVARVYTTGEKVRVYSDGTLPDGLMAGVDYYVIYISATEIRLAESLVNALNGVEISLADDGSGNHTVKLYSCSSIAYQQESRDRASIGVSDGVKAWQEFSLPDLDVIRSTLQIEINGSWWSVVDSLTNSISTDKHCLLRYNTDGSSYLLFGDGEYGMIPPSFDVEVTYSIGGGLISNISKLNEINTYAGSDADITGVTNVVPFTGGGEAESTETAKRIAPILLKSRDRFVTIEDGRALAENFPGVGKANVLTNTYGVLSASVPIVPNGGGLPSSTLKSDLQSYLLDRTVLESIDVRVVDPTYNLIAVTASVKMDTGYSWPIVQEFVVLALRLLFTETGQEILDLYAQNGVSAATAFINSKWSTSFTSADSEQIVRLLENLLPTDFGKDFQASDVLGYVDTYVNGVDYFVISSPAFPITQAEDEITQDNISSGDIVQI